MKKLTGIILVILLVVSVAACAKAPSPEPVPIPGPAPYPQEGPPAPLPPGATPTPAPVPAPEPLPSEAVRPSQIPITEEGAVTSMPELGETWATERMIVRTAAMALVVVDVPGSIDQIAQLAESLGGYVVSSEKWRQEERLFGIITIRVPAEDFGNAMEALRGLAVDVTHEETSSQDVTEEYIDLSAQLHNLEITEEQLLKLMEKAEKVEDILNVQRELSKTRGEIEQTKGRMQYLERTSATSLIRVQLEQSELDVNFSADKKRVKEGERIYFEGRVAGGFPPYSYEWDFGDGETSTSAYPTHAYKAAGSYTVSMQVTDDRGNTKSRTRDDYILVSPGWSAGNITSGAGNGLVIFGHVLADIFIWLGIFSPVWIVIGGGVYWWWRKKKKRA